MEWQPEIKNWYDGMIQKMPEFARPIVGPALTQKCEQKCEKRGGKAVSEIDFIISIFEVTPPAIQPQMMQDLESLGIDYVKWLPYVKGGFEHEMDLDKMVGDLKAIADFAGVKFNEKKVWDVIKAYEEFFAGSSISIRTTTKPKERRDVSIRYVELMVPHEPDAYKRALDNGFISPNGHPIYDIFYEVDEKFDVMGYGVDLNVTVGLTKLWSFIAPSPLDLAYGMENLPKGVLEYKDYFKKHNLNTFVLFALDYYHKTTNLYFLVKDTANIKRETYEALLEDVGFAIASPEVMDRCCEATTIYYTFNWESEKVERVCFGILCPEGASQVPTHFHPIMKSFVEKVPFAVDKRTFIYSITFTGDDHFFKVENDYNGTMIELLKMGAKAGLDL